MITPTVRRYLDDHHISYKTINHVPAYTAQETAQLSHISGKEIAKCVIVKIDGKLAMIVEPASIRLDLSWIKAWLKANQVELANEQEFQECFPDCELGAMPPFGNLYGMDVIVDDMLTEDRTIAFNGGTHTDLVEMAYKDYENLVKPRLMRGH
ncbi:MAG: YbaK/EbsC family protein [Gammaproteobacteria bacterium]